MPKLKRPEYDCLRQKGNSSEFPHKYKFDNAKFDADGLIRDLPQMSPKMLALFDNIRRLDEEDLARDQKLYKHYIYSDVDEQGYGAKFIASCFWAEGFKSVLVKVGGKLQMVPGPNTFGMLLSGSMWGAEYPAKLKKAVREIFNARDDAEPVNRDIKVKYGATNEHGQLMRFIILDSKFKEGIDLFDVKYCHMFEPLTTLSQLKQVVGRGTRTCGQKGITFVPKVGWKLHVFTYASTVPEAGRGLVMPDGLTVFEKNNSVHDAIVHYSGMDPTLLELTNKLEGLAPFLAVDCELTKKVHQQEPENVIEYQAGGYLLRDLKTRSDTKKRWQNREMAKIAREAKTRKSKIRPHSPSPKISPKSPIKKCPAEETELPTEIDRRSYLDLAKRLHPDKNPDCLEYATFQFQKLNDLRNSSPLKRERTLQLKDGPRHIPPPAKGLNYAEMRNYILKYYHRPEFTWKSIEAVNHCGENKPSEPIMTFNATQTFIPKYFTPASPLKGMLLWHSVGTGKTCTGIATATATFEPEGYTIIWVTRASLKKDVVKNMYKKICDHVLIDRIKEGKVKLPITHMNKRAAWLEPAISYKTFSNMLSRGNGNKLFNKLASRNPADVLWKTLIVIDEAHKLYSGELETLEQPDMKVLEQMLDKSYRVSGTESARVLLMTATPITKSPFELFKLINLCKEEKLPAELSEFKEKFGVEVDNMKLADSLAGYISYLNLEKDVSQFAQAVHTTVQVPLSMEESPKDEAKELKELKMQMETLKAQKKKCLTKKGGGFEFFKNWYDKTFYKYTAPPFEPEIREEPTEVPVLVQSPPKIPENINKSPRKSPELIQKSPPKGSLSPKCHDKKYYDEQLTLLKNKIEQTKKVKAKKKTDKYQMSALQTCLKKSETKKKYKT
jgi:superfamily II DNA or RNA helicase